MLKKVWPYLVAGFLVLLAGVALLVSLPLRNMSRVTRSYGTGRISVSFKDNTTYQHAQQVLSNAGLTNTQVSFMQPYLTVDNPVSIESSPIAELNAFNATLDELNHSAGVSRAIYANDSQLYVYFEPTVDEVTARAILARFNLKISSGTSIHKSYDAEVRVPVGREPEYINDLYRDASVERASEPILTVN